ncbi:hypothetical protein OC845_003729 [Tilletia horrida]|nr:hypothetical protein OC845_003729 [Tilletia horrida]
MARIPPFLVRLASALAAEHITKRLVASPAFNRMVARMLHEVDHLPHRINGQPVPPYTPPHGQQFDLPHKDVGEPHDEPDPFAKAGNSKSQSTSTMRDAHTQSNTASSTGAFHPRSRLRNAQSTGQHGAPHSTQDSRSQAPPKAEETPSERIARELKELQDKIRRGS